jgi:aerobic carbon-monoxide dehydrogenase large subunit
MSTRMFGARIERNIDAKLLKGEGAFVDDIPLAGALHVAFARSVHARARIRAIDTTAARRHPGVVAVYTARDIGDLDITMPLLIPHPSMAHPKTQRPWREMTCFTSGRRSRWWSRSIVMSRRTPSG